MVSEKLCGFRQEITKESESIVRRVNCAWPVLWRVDHSVGLSIHVSDIANYFPSLDQDLLFDRNLLFNWDLLFGVGQGGKGCHLSTVL